MMMSPTLNPGICNEGSTHDGNDTLVVELDLGDLLKTSHGRKSMLVG